MKTSRPATVGTTPRPRTVPTASLIPNPHNPRLLFDELPLDALAASIKKVGVLVPLTVFKARGSSKFTILDGQRRWICAQRIGLETIPINEVSEPSTAQNIVTMFQIHKLRKDWELMPTALKLEVLMTELDERRDGDLAELTGLDIAVVTRCKKLLTYEKVYQELMLFATPEDRVKADFFIELYAILSDRVVNRAKWFNRQFIIDSFLRKYQAKKSGFKSITDFRKIKQYINIARDAGHEKEITSKLKRLLDDDSFMISDLEIDSAKFHKVATSMIRTLSRLKSEIDSLEPDSYVGEEDLWLHLEELFKSISKKLVSADRRVH